MTLQEAVDINKRISILPRQLAHEIRKLDILIVKEIIEDPAEQLMYCKLDLFLKAIRENYDLDSLEIEDIVFRTAEYKSINLERYRRSVKYKRSKKAFQNMPSRYQVPV
jgi:hypothetical protein